MYILINAEIIQRISDGAFIPVAEGNKDYQDILDFAALGGIIAPIDTPDPKALALTTIQDLEQQQIAKSTRGLREFIIAISEGLAAMKGVTPAQLKATNVFYSTMKDLDTQIAAERHLL